MSAAWIWGYHAKAMLALGGMGSCVLHWTLCFVPCAGMAHLRTAPQDCSGCIGWEVCFTLLVCIQMRNLGSGSGSCYLCGRCVARYIALRMACIHHYCALAVKLMFCVGMQTKRRRALMAVALIAIVHVHLFFEYPHKRKASSWLICECWCKIQMLI